MDESPDREVIVFNAALQLPAAQRAAYLHEVCGEDRGLRSRVEALLEAEAAAGAFLDEPAVGPGPFRPAGGVSGTLVKLSLSTSLAEKAGDRIGHYKLLQQIGEGGCGIVYMAEQEAPVRRRVALKVIKLGMDTKNVIARFEAERQALAMMDHAGIARVFDAGATETGRPFFVMELVRGLKITHYCDENQLSTRERLKLFVQVCRAVQHAHQKGVIHRDLKPSNILVTVNDGVAVPKVIDFGIAKATQGRLTDQTLFTAFEQFIGTPAYMSPEQSVFTSVDIDTRSDIYSLGVLLYELLTGQTPFDPKELLATGLEAMRRTIQEKEPERPSTRLSTMAAGDLKTIAHHRQSDPPKLVHLVRGDLDWIVMKCLEKDRARRYDTANGLAMDVQRFLANEPIVARPPSNLYRLQKLIGRNRLAVGAAGAVGTALVLGLGFSTWQYLEKSQAEREQSRLRVQAQAAQVSEAQSRRRAEAQELAARKKAYASDMNLLQQALAADDLARAQVLLDRQRPQPGQSDLRGWEWRYFWRFCQSDAAFTLCQRSNSILSVSFSSDGAFLAVGTYDHEVTVWEVASRRLIYRHGGSHGFPARLAFAPTGSTLAFYNYANDQANVVLWDSRRQEEIHRLRLKGALRGLAFSGDGRLFTADLSVSNNITIWDVERGAVLRTFTGSMPGYAMGTVFNVARDGRRFARALRGTAHSVQVVDTEAGTNANFRAAEELTTALAFSPDGRILATGGGYAEGIIKLWDAATGQAIGSLEGHRSWVSCLRFLADGKTLVSASADRTVRLWDIESRQPLQTLRGQRAELWTVDLSSDGRWLASGSKDGSVSLWDLRSSTHRPPPYRRLQPADSRSWTFSPDGQWLGVVGRNKVTLYDASTLQLAQEPDLGFASIGSLAFSPDSRQLVVTDRTGHLAVWDLPKQRRVTNFVAHPTPEAPCAAAFLADGKSLLTFGAERVAKEWDTATWTERRHWPLPDRYQALAVSPQTDLVAFAADDRVFHLVRARTPDQRRRFSGEARVDNITLSRDDKIFAAASENGTLELWDTDSLTRKALLGGVLLGFHSVAISPDGQRIAAGSNGQEAMKLWDLQSYEEVATLQGQGSFFSDAEFSPDGNTIGARNWNGIIHLWTAPSWKEIDAAEQARRTGMP